MEQVGISEIVYLVLGIVFLLVRNKVTHTVGDAVKTVVRNKGNETQIKVDDSHVCLEKKIDSVAANLATSISATISERASHSAALEEFRRENAVYSHNLKRVVAQVGIAWEDEVTVVTEPKKVTE